MVLIGDGPKICIPALQLGPKAVVYDRLGAQVTANGQPWTWRFHGMKRLEN